MKQGRIMNCETLGGKVRKLLCLNTVQSCMPFTLSEKPCGKTTKMGYHDALPCSLSHSTMLSSIPTSFIKLQHINL